MIGSWRLAWAAAWAPICASCWTEKRLIAAAGRAEAASRPPASIAAAAERRRDRNMAYPLRPMRQGSLEQAGCHGRLRLPSPPPQETPAFQGVADREIPT